MNTPAAHCGLAAGCNFSFFGRGQPSLTLAWSRSNCGGQLVSPLSMNCDVFFLCSVRGSRSAALLFFCCFSYTAAAGNSSTHLCAFVMRKANHAVQASCRLKVIPVHSLESETGLAITPSAILTLYSETLVLDCSPVCAKQWMVKWVDCYDSEVMIHPSSLLSSGLLKKIVD